MKAVIDIKKYKTNQQIKNIARHNFRIKISRNVNKEKTKQNKFYIGSQDMNVLEELEKKLENCPKFRKDAVKTVNLVFSASHEFFVMSSKEKIEDWEKSTQKFIEETFGKDNILYSVVHYDERTPHFHVAIVPIKDGKLNASYWFDGPEKLRKLHTNYAKAVNHLGIKRGVPNGTKSSQKELEDYYKKVNESVAYEEHLEKKIKELLNNIKSPTLTQRMNWSSFVKEAIQPLLKLFQKSLSYYRTKYHESKKALIKNEELNKQNDELKKQIQSLEVKLETIGIDPKTSYAKLNELAPEIKNLLKHLEQSKKQDFSDHITNKAPEINQINKKKLKFG